MTKTSIVWIRRDFRLADNPALDYAITHSEQVAFVYIHAPDEQAPWQPGAASNWWLHHSLVAFDRNLNAKNARLIIRRGKSSDILLQLCEQLEADMVCWNRLYEPAMVSRDTDIKKQLQQIGVTPHSFNGALLREPWEVHKDDGSMYRVFTPFSKKHLQLVAIKAPLEAPKRRSLNSIQLDSTSIESLKLLPDKNWDQGFYSHWQPGEQGALARLSEFLEGGVEHYQDARDRPARQEVSQMSPHLHFGEISPRQIWHAALFQQDYLTDQGRQDCRDDIAAYLRQLIWRDFAHHLLFHLPDSDIKPFREKFNQFEWQKNQPLLRAWQLGQTGIPLVDAGMRQLWHTGWMHNRVRMLVASVLTKNGLVHWLEGAHWFWDTLVDASLANNTMGWQWVAGCGVDAAPYFRIFSPVRQGERFDPDGEYVRHWVPEIASLPSKYIHQPWAASNQILEQADIQLGRDYPDPIVDLSNSRERALALYKRLS